MNFKTTLSECKTQPSNFTKTGLLYIHNGRIILEYMKSTKNVWVDTEFIPKKEDELQAKKDINEFFNNKTKSIFFGSDFNDANDTIKASIKKGLEDICANADEKSVSELYDSTLKTFHIFR